jgi:hypothetical protein
MMKKIIGDKIKEYRENFVPKKIQKYFRATPKKT